MKTRLLTSLALASALLLTACKKQGSDPDPTYDKALPTMEDVDDAHQELARGDGDRVRATYKSTDAIRGAAEPLVTIVEYSDFQCPFCGTFANTVHELEKVYPDDLRVVFHQYPMPMHPQAPLAAKAAIAAQQQGKFWAMHDWMFANRSSLSRADLLAAAGDLGLDTAKFEADLDSEETQARLEFETTLGRRLGVRGTPSFFVNGKRYSGAMDAEALGKIIDEERAFAKTLIDAGVPRTEVFARIMRAAKVAGAR
ncbi:MAG: DsbA family protein [Nannocystaceae bacterium]|nr:thioredoxin domain-containing protein [bacterium]